MRREKDICCIIKSKPRLMRLWYISEALQDFITPNMVPTTCKFNN